MSPRRCASEKKHVIVLHVKIHKYVVGGKPFARLERDTTRYMGVK